ncbi:peptidylprolyl isomerase [Tropicimonas sp. TH_r6]|uniref:peptidylprolyl isomerase n=1 Tax=Tropicimonas sp. TH_r6 TaxID=3082085 RepID=UPI0029553CEB|nr:peptidylprolyl isomerase [Tropicimonas sp. TH_r6]MDV7145459.1 peptidylprolyl isomerase [Tropicimonas sp. TH_r6]
MKIIREPLFHFFLLGLAIFGWFLWLNPSEPEPVAGNRITVDAGDAERLSSQFEMTWRRKPQSVELQGLMEALVREEVLVREARELGLDKGDGVIRNRLAQKMTFLATSVAQAVSPEDTVLISHLEANPERFATSPRLAFEQILLPGDGAAAEILASLEAGADPITLGAPTLLPAALPLSIEAVVDGTFGRGFFAALADQPVDQWTQVMSGYGPHLVRVTEAVAARQPAFEEIREDVLMDWKRTQVEALTAAQIDALKAKYEIELPSADEIAGWAGQ